MLDFPSLQHHIQQHQRRSPTPFIMLKWAQSLDGNLALPNGVSQWLTDENARGVGQQLRSISDAVAVGGETLRNDNPGLDVRVPMGPQKGDLIPRPVVFTRSGELPFEAKIFQQTKAKPLIISAAEISGPPTPCQVWTRSLNHTDDWMQLLRQLKKEGIHCLLVEGGARLLSSFLEHRLAHKAFIFVAPLLAGQGRKVWGQHCLTALKDAYRLQVDAFHPIGGQVLIEASL